MLNFLGSVVTRLIALPAFPEDIPIARMPPQAVQMLPGYTHNIINLSETEDLVTVMYCNEIFNPNRPDTYFDPVKQ